MTKSHASPTRKVARLDVSICRHPLCFVAVPTDRLEAHEQWHANRKKMRS